MKQFLLICSLTMMATFSLLAQPVNDDCANAIVFTVGDTLEFTTIDATTESLIHSDCFGTNDSILLDVWYTFTATDDAVLRWTNCGTADFDSRIAIYNTALACDATADNLVACNDDGPASCSDDFFTSEVLFAVTAGENYVFQMGGFTEEEGTTTTGSGTVALTEVENIPANTFCANATVLELGNAQEFTTINAITDGPNHEGSPCFGFGSITAVSDIWFTYTPDFTGFVKWSTCNIVDFDTRLAVYNPGSNCPPLDEDLYSCNDDGGGCSDFSSELTFEVIEGETYLMRLGGYDGSGSGAFDFAMIIPIDPPVNDDCSNAIAVDLLTLEQANDLTLLTEGTTVAGTFINEDYQYPICLTNQNGGEFSDVWYSFESLGNTAIDIQFLATGEGEVPATNFYMDIFASCDSMVDTTIIINSCIAINEEISFVSQLLTGLPEGENVTYYVRITTRLTSDIPGNFAFQLAADIVSDVNDLVLTKDLGLFPNPVKDQATVRFTLADSYQINAYVTDVLGHQVQRHQLGLLFNGQQQFEFNTSELPAGIYFLQLSSGNKQQTLRFVVL